MDEDLDLMTRGELIDEVIKLRQGIRRARIVGTSDLITDDRDESDVDVVLKMRSPSMSPMECLKKFNAASLSDAKSVFISEIFTVEQTIIGRNKPSINMLRDGTHCE